MFFMAWNYSRYINAIVEAGKKAYNIPMYANAWMPNPRPTPGKPGNFPSGGPILSVLDIWKAGAPAIDFLSPDLYGGDFKDEAKFFHRADNPLFIPETNTTDGPGTYAFAEEDAICFSPFGIDNQGGVMVKEYGMLSQLMQTGENEFIVAGYNLSVSANSTSDKKQVWLNDAWEGSYVDGVWNPIALHNGDEAGFLRSGDPVYRIGAYRTFPSEPAIFHFKAVPYDK